MRLATTCLIITAIRNPDGSDAEVARLNLLELQRAAEISADRIGYLGCGSQATCCSAILKTATGLGAEHIQIAPSALLDQLREIESLGGANHAVGASHPMFPISYARITAVRHE